MPIPSLNEHGLLPPGIHDCLLHEVADVFGIFQLTDRRARLFEKLEILVREVRATQLIRAIIIDGSFVTGKAIPEDIDLILIFPGNYDEGAELLPVQYNSLKRQRLRKRFGFDVLTVIENTEEYDRSVEFFGQIRDQPDLRKGMLRIIL